MEILTNEENAILVNLIKLKKAYSKVMGDMHDILAKDKHTEEDRRQLALLTYKRICLDKLDKYFFCQDKILDREKVDLDELIGN